MDSNVACSPWIIRAGSEGPGKLRHRLCQDVFLSDWHLSLPPDVPRVFAFLRSVLYKLRAIQQSSGWHRITKIYELILSACLGFRVRQLPYYIDSCKFYFNCHFLENHQKAFCYIKMILLLRMRKRWLLYKYSYAINFFLFFIEGYKTKLIQERN